MVSTTPPITKSDAVSQIWQMSVPGKANVDLQLGYMGLGLDISGTNVRSVTFPASGDNHTYVTDEPGFQTFLNDKSRGTDLRDAVAYDQHLRKMAKQNAPLPKYYIVTDALTAKNLTVTLNPSTSTSLQLSTTQYIQLE